MQGLGADGAPFVATSWDDRVDVSNPRVEDGRAIVSVHDVLALGPPQGEMVVDFIEGFHVAADGSAGARFFEVGGAETIEQPLDAQAFAFESAFAASDRPLIQRNPDALTDRCRHYSLRIVDEKEEVTRLTRLVWSDGTTQTFVSMQGAHQRQ
jgi:hypothetical protein